MWWAFVFLAAGPYEEGLKLLAAGRWQEARGQLEKVVAAEPGNALAWKALGVAAGQGGDVAEAEEAFGKGCKLGPGLEDVCYYHARSLYTLNRFGPAIQVLEGLRKRESRQGRLLTALGQAYEANGESGKAERAFEEAVRQADHRGEALLRYGVFLFRAGRLEEAEKRVRQAIEAAPANVEAQAELGRVLYQRGELQEAIVVLEKSAGGFEWAQRLLEKARRREAAREEP